MVFILLCSRLKRPEKKTAERFFSAVSVVFGAQLPLSPRRNKGVKIKASAKHLRILS